jgi:hypothetical protein
MPKYKFRFRFSVPSGTKLIGDHAEVDYNWCNYPVHIVVKPFQPASTPGGVAYECYGSHFGTREKGLRCGADTERRLTRAALSCGFGANLWTDYEPGQIPVYVLSMEPSIVPAPAYADRPGICVYEDSGTTHFVRMTLADRGSQRSLEDFAAAFRSTEPPSHQETAQEDLALALASMARFEPYTSEHFLALTSALEVLAKQTDNTGPIKAVIERLISEANADSTLSSKEHDEVRNRLGELNKVSHLAAIRTMIQERLPGKRYGNQNATDFAAKCYNQRGRMLHEGADLLDNTAISLLLDLEYMLYDLLGIVRRTPSG